MAKGIGILPLGVLLLGGLAVWEANGAPAQKAANNPASLSPAERRVREALVAELAGDNARRNELLGQALKEDPNCRAARWQSGYVNLDGRWVTPTVAAENFSSDRNLAEYRRRRDAAASAGLFARGAVHTEQSNAAVRPNESRATVVETHRSDALPAEGIAAHAELARWCRSKRLVDEERAHWTQVLLEDPKSSEAESRLGMRSFSGGLYTNAQIDAIKKQHSLEEKQLTDWKPIVTGWMKSLDSGSNSEKIQAVDEMANVKDPAVIPGLEWANNVDSAKLPVSRNSATAFQRQAVALLGRLPMQRATYSLTLDAVLARQSEVRSTAANELKKRSLHDFVPILLAGLANPIQFEYSLDASDGIFAYEAVISQEGREKVSETQVSRVIAGSSTDTTLTYYPNRGRTFGISITPGPAEVGKGSVVADGHRDGRAFANAIERKNEQIDRMNRRIEIVLETATGQRPTVETSSQDDSEAIPESVLASPTNSTANYWWAWWDRYNEKQVPYSKPTEVTQYARSTIYSPTALPGIDVNPSCFSAGTTVLTVTGWTAIGKLQIGDRVLAQDVDTGELAYKPVLGTTVRPPVEMVLITTSSGALRTTRGHPFWIVGKGWRMAKELQVGDRVHCLDGSATVTATHAEPPERAYNLIVADFGTYFVGDGRILVHDNTPRLPTPATLPGFVKAER